MAWSRSWQYCQFCVVNRSWKTLFAGQQAAVSLTLFEHSNTAQETEILIKLVPYFTINFGDLINHVFKHTCQGQIQDLSDGWAPPHEEGGIVFAENCMKMETIALRLQCRIYNFGRQPPPSRFNFLHFHAIFGEIWPYKRSVPFFGVGAPSPVSEILDLPQGRVRAYHTSPGSATVCDELTRVNTGLGVYAG